MALTISQALRRIKKLKGELAVHLTRAASSNTFKAGEDPAFRFGPMMELAHTAREELIRLETQVACTNAQTMIGKDSPITLTEATKRLRELKSQLSWYESLNCREQTETTSKEVDYDHDGPGRHYVTTVWLCDMPVAKKATRVTELQESFDRLNDAVETANHRTELIR